MLTVEETTSFKYNHDMSFSKSILILFSVFIFGLTTLADSQDQAFIDYKASATKITDQLLAKGYQKIGPIDLAKLREEILATKWVAITDRFLLGSGEGRATGVYLTKERTTFTNLLALKLIVKEIYPQQSLHEVLGANGYEDENSQISLSMDQLANNPKANFAFFEKQIQAAKVGLTQNKVYASRGGSGTSVGGGGDGTCIEFRKRLLDAAEILNDEAVLTKILLLKIEPDWNHENTTLRWVKQNKETILVIPSVSWMTYGLYPDGELMKIDLVYSVLKELISGIK